MRALLIAFAGALSKAAKGGDGRGAASRTFEGSPGVCAAER